jgi:hypothetical protein
LRRKDSSFVSSSETSYFSSYLRVSFSLGAWKLSSAAGPDWRTRERLADLEPPDGFNPSTKTTTAAQAVGGFVAPQLRGPQLTRDLVLIGIACG